MEDNQLAIIKNSIEVFKSAPQILQENKQRSAKAVIIGGKILAEWKAADAITDLESKVAAMALLDVRSNNFLVNSGTALKDMKENRAAITQLMDNFKKMFFEAETDLDRDKDVSCQFRIQQNRNNFAKLDAQLKNKKIVEAQIKEAKAKELIKVKAEINTSLFDLYNVFLLEKKEKMQAYFDGITLETFDAKSEALYNFNPILIREQIKDFPAKVNIYTQHIEKQEFSGFLVDAIDSLFSEKQHNYNAEMMLLKEDLIDMLPSKRTSLIEAQEAAAEKLANDKKIAEAKNAEDIEEAKAEKLRLETKEKALAAAEALRKEEAARKFERDAAEAKQKNDLAVNIKKQGEETMAMFDKESDLAEIPVATAQVKQGYEITVMHQAGWVQIFTSWYEKEGKNLTVDKIGAVKMDQMKTWCEKQAFAHGTFIESKFIKYEETYKAIAKKAKI